MRLLQTAKLVLMSKRGPNGAPPAAPLTFALKGEVDARGPLKITKTSAQLYDFQELEVKLTNPFQVRLLLACLLPKQAPKRMKSWLQQTL